jgi:anti-sigma factor RsiW
MQSASDRDGHVQVLLGAYLLGGLPAREATEVRAHLAVCVQCQAEHDELACVPGWLDLLREVGDDGSSLAAGLGTDAAAEQPAQESGGSAARRPDAGRPQSSPEPGTGLRT